MTYSIVARDPQTGELGVAVQSHWFGVGPLVPWARPGVGAAATQANVRVAYGPEALELLASGVGAEEALARLTAADPGAAGRQLAIVDAHGGVAAHTGTACMDFAGHVTGDAGLLPGQHHGQRDRLVTHVGDVFHGGRPAGQPPACGARRSRGSRRGYPRASVGGAAGRAGRRASVGDDGLAPGRGSP